jgi:tetrachlorobenzoquinone reductase
VNIAVSPTLDFARSSVLSLRVECIRREAAGVISIELGSPSGDALPHWTPGSHLQLHLPSGLVRHYSLCGPSHLTHYRIAVRREENGRGGSREIHNNLRAGDIVRAEGPLNRFELGEANSYLFIAGGIGITPLLPMIVSVDRSGREWNLAYCGKSPGDMAFLAELERFSASRVALYPKNKTGRADLRELVARCASDAHVYACGPSEMLDSLQAICEDRKDISLRVERFAAPATLPNQPAIEADKSFEVFLQRSGITLTIPSTSTILQEVKKVIPDAPFSCESGYCGTCEARVVSGTVIHRDTLLTAGERANSKTMMICVSRACGRLVLDM